MRKLNTDIIVGLFLVAGFLCFVWLSLKLGEFPFLASRNSYVVSAAFDNVSGLKKGAVVEIAGVRVGSVERISLNDDYRAEITMRIDKGVRIGDDAIASIRTKGIIGDKYVRIVPGASEEFLGNGDRIEDTESAVDLEELVSKYIFGGMK
jgi:phospholipid/cholesterol/gamma-HCH transport system substrate-binding protein